MKSTILAGLVAGASATVYFKESFDSCKFFFSFPSKKICDPEKYHPPRVFFKTHIKSSSYSNIITFLCFLLPTL